MNNNFFVSEPEFIHDLLNFEKVVKVSVVDCVCTAKTTRGWIVIVKLICNFFVGVLLLKIVLIHCGGIAAT